MKGTAMQGPVGFSSQAPWIKGQCPIVKPSRSVSRLEGVWGFGVDSFKVSAVCRFRVWGFRRHHD